MLFAFIFLNCCILCFGLNSIDEVAGKEHDVDEIDDDEIQHKGFYEDHVREGIPLVIRQLAESSEWSEQFVRKNFGDAKVTVERNTDKMDLNSFFDNLSQNAEFSVATKLDDSMMSHLTLPSVLNCGGFTLGLTTAGLRIQTKSDKHHVMKWNTIMCSLEGEVKLTIYAGMDNYENTDDYPYEEHVMPVDLQKWDQKHLEVARMKRGDCVFLPQDAYVFSQSTSKTNIMSFISFDNFFWFNESSCYGVTPDTTVSLNDVIFDDKDNLYTMTNEIFINLQEEEMFSRQQFIDNLLDELDREHGNNSSEAIVVNEARNLFAKLDTNKNNELTWEELYHISVDDLGLVWKAIVEAHDIEDEAESKENQDEDSDDEIHDEL